VLYDVPPKSLPLLEKPADRRKASMADYGWKATEARSEDRPDILKPNRSACAGFSKKDFETAPDVIDVRA
jgi:hypothetical protein